MGDGFMVFFIVFAVIAVLIFIFTISFMFNTKIRGKIMSKQIESLREASNLSKDDFENIITTLQTSAIKSKKEVLASNEEDLKNIADANARINKDAIRETASAIKDGFTSNGMHCKYCGKLIDIDSRYCKNCGEKL